MKKFLSTVKGKVIAGAVTLAVIAAAVFTIVLLNIGYRTISVDDLTGVTTITAGESVSEAFKGQNLRSGCKVFVQKSSDLTLALDTDKHVYAKELTGFSLEAAGKPGKDSRTVIRLDEGSVLSEIDEKLSADESYVVESPNATMAVRGTVFTVTVSFDEEGLCHTLVEVEEGTVEVTKKDENGDPTDEVQTLQAGGKTEVISLVINRNEEDETLSDGNSSSSNNNSSPERIEVTYQNPDALAVEAALETFLNGGELDTANIDRVTSLIIEGRVAFVTLDGQFGGKRTAGGTNFSDKEIISTSYLSETGEEIELPTSNSDLTDLNFLTEMKRLRKLSICFGNVTDITPIGQLSELTDLNLEFNEITDISPLEDLTDLITLYLDHNQISDIAAIKGMNKLWSLGISDNNISDISPLSELTDLEDLGLGANIISDLSPISGSTKLTSLHLYGNNISDLSPISGLKKLDFLVLGGNNISDLSPISGLTNLTELQISEANVSDLSPISGLTNLTWLHIFSNNISDISPVANLHKLESIYIFSEAVNDFSPLYGLTNLQTIYLSNGVDDEELAKLRQALPDAFINAE